MGHWKLGGVRLMSGVHLYCGLYKTTRIQDPSRVRISLPSRLGLYVSGRLVPSDSYYDSRIHHPNADIQIALLIRMPELMLL